MTEMPSLKSQATITGLVLTTCLGGFVSTYNLVCLTQMGPLLKMQKNLSQEQLIWKLTIATSIFNVGGIFGPIIYHRCSHLLAKLSIPSILVFIDLICILCTSIIIYQLSFPALIIFRFVMGILVGVSITLVPVFIKIMSPPQIAAKMGSFNQLLQTSGVLGSSLLGFLIIDPQINDDIYWRIFLGFPILPLILRVLSLKFVYPYDQKNRQSLKKFMHKTYFHSEKSYDLFLDRNGNKKVEDDEHNKKQQNMRKDTYGSRLMIGLVLMASNQITGIGSILFYLKQFLYKVIEPNPDNIYHIQVVMCLLSVTQIVSTFVSARQIQKEGRKKKILQGQLSIIVILLCIYLTAQIRQYVNSSILDAILVALIFGHIVAHNKGLGVACIIYCADILQDLSWMIVALKICSSTVSLSSQYMIQYLGISNMFLFFAALSTVAHAYLRTRIIQTKHKSKPQIYSLFYGQLQQQKPKNI